MSQDLQQNRYDQLLRRAGGLIGPGSKVNEVLGELFPVIDVERVPGELLRLMGTFPAFGSASITGAVGESGRVQLFNPVDSGNIITISTVYVTVGNTDTIRAGVATAALTTGVATQIHRDTRTPVTVLPTGQIRTQSSAALAPATLQLRTSGSVLVRIVDPNGVAILSPGSGFEVGNTTNNILIFVNFLWRERVAEQSELNL